MTQASAMDEQFLTAGTGFLQTDAAVSADVARDRERRRRRRMKTIIGTLITLAIFVWMFRPIVMRWHDVNTRIGETSLWKFAVAAGMFAAFLFVFRVTSWRWIVGAFGHRLPLPAAARIWSTSELARYLPGVIWQVVGRVYLVKPYGVSAAECSTSQVLELAVFLLANVLVALACLPWFAGQMPHEVRSLLYSGAALAPLLLLLLIPRVFYGAIDGILKKLRKPPIAVRMPGRQLAGLVGWAVAGLLWQGLAIWLLMGQRHALNLDISRLGLVVGAYCLAWCAGFLAFWAPGGLGTREFVLILTLRFALPPTVAQHFGDEASFNAFISFLAVLLRLWTIAGEIILTSIAYASDYRGALGDPTAPGRIAEPAVSS
jgi:uncharacterized membrane protein YbhN (UPF0104 family)